MIKKINEVRNWRKSKNTPWISVIFLLILLITLAGCQKVSDEEKVIDTLEKWNKSLTDEKVDSSKYEVTKNLDLQLQFIQVVSSLSPNDPYIKMTYKKENVWVMDDLALLIVPLYTRSSFIGQIEIKFEKKKGKWLLSDIKEYTI